MQQSSYFENLPVNFILPVTKVERRLLKEYGAMFVAKSVIVPDRVLFQNASNVRSFQSTLNSTKAEIGEFVVELQAVAMKALQAAIGDATASGLTITPRGQDSAARDYDETVELWASRVIPGMRHWVSNGRLGSNEAERILALEPSEQVSEIFELEEDGIFFAKDLSKPIMYSVAPPGASQHLSMLAFDAAEYESSDVREILAKHRWYQTVVSDLPHFTFLGIEENNLGDVGLKKVLNGGRTFWLPAI